ncbi:MAG: OB-fold protein [Nocardioides sp.]|uniref:OB-fold protein n=1 Tax=Nocardioides sp. TaxID=35761 RepID=UPI003D6BF1B7
MPSPAPGPEQILNHEIGKSVATGWTLVSNQNGYAILNRGGKVRHLMHGLISLFTCGTWLLGWAIVAILGARQVLTISVDERGLVNRQEPKPRWPYVAAVVAAFVVIGSIAAANGGGGTDTTATDDSSEAAAQGGDVKAEESNAPAKAKEKPKPKAKPIVVSASDLIKEFEASEFTADKKYKGKTLKITGGVVSSIDAQLFDDDKYDVSFDGGGDFEILGIHCRSVANKYLDTLAPGKEVTVTGKFDDGGDLGVEMKSCDF